MFIVKKNVSEQNAQNIEYIYNIKLSETKKQRILRKQYQNLCALSTPLLINMKSRVQQQTQEGMIIH